MKGDWPGFSGGGDGGYADGQDYNSAGSNSVREVDSITTISNSHSMPKVASPNSVTKNYKDGKLKSERYFDSGGKPYLDIDYSDHGNPSAHPHVPHEHEITFDEKGNMHRGKERGIK